MTRKELTLDRRTQADLCRRVEELAASYTPEWRFDRRDPDVGSTLADRLGTEAASTQGIASAAEMMSNVIGMLLVIGANTIARKASDVSLY